MPLCYSLLFPNPEIRHIVRAFEGREDLEGLLAPLASVTNSVGRLKRAIQVTAYWGVSAEHKGGESHTTKTAEVSYLAWFEKRSKPTILVVTRTQVDNSRARFDTDEGSLLRTLRIYLVPAVALAFSVYWFVSRRSFERQSVTGVDHPPQQEDASA